MQSPTENKELMRRAREALHGKWDIAVPAAMVYLLITAGASAFPGIPPLAPVVSLIIGGPMMLGMTIFSLALARNQPATINMLFDGFKNFGTALATHLLRTVFIVLWSLLLIVPGIIAALSYSQAFFLLAADPSLHAMEAIDKSKAMMYGYKWKLFCLCLRFFGWFLLCLLTAGIGFFWLVPYMQVTFAKFHDDLKSNRAI